MSLQDYIQIKEAAELLGVSQKTLRSWERNGKIIAYRHPANGYRLFKKLDLVAFLSNIEQSASHKRQTEDSSVREHNETGGGSSAM